MSDPVYDLIIIGGGCAGLSAGVYAGRAKLKTLVLEKSLPGGQAANTAEVVNYPGVRRTTGPALTEEMHRHAMDFGVRFRTAEIERAELQGEVKTLYTREGAFKSRAVIVATGAAPRKIGFQGEREFTGRGIAYCATCDGEFFAGLDIFVIGGGFAAAEEAVYLTRFGNSVTVVVREPDFTCARTVAEKTLAHPKIKVLFNTEVVSVEGDKLLHKAAFRNSVTGETTVYEAKDGGTFGMFVFAGYQPATALFKGQLDLDEGGHVLTDDAMRTSVPGVFAAGDLRPKILRQIVTAVADGAIAATSAEKYVTLEKERLGLPMFEPDDPAPPEPPNSAAQPVTADGRFISAALAAQLRDVFAKLKRDVTIVTVVDPANPKSLEMRQFLEEVAPLSERIKLKAVEKGQDPALEAELDIKRWPVTALYDDAGNYTGVKFSGIPGGHEMNSFVLAIYRLAGDIGLSEAELGRIAALEKPAKIEVCVSLSCHLCPDVVAAAQNIAAASPRVSAEMVDMALFPELRAQHDIMSVPAMIINGEKIVFGSKTLGEILDILEAL